MKMVNFSLTVLEQENVEALKRPQALLFHRLNSEN